MRKLGAGVLAAALLGAAVSVAAAQDDQDESDTKAVPVDRAPWKRDTNKSANKPKAAPAAAKKEAPAKPAGPSLVQRNAEEQTRQRNALLRRLQVCNRLRQVAQEKGDAELESRADELEAQAWEIYQRQAARLGLAGSPDEAALQRKLDTGTALPGESAPGGAARQDTRRAALKGEDRP
jgi:hypothetical protein